MREFEMTEEQYKELLDASRAVPYLVMNGSEPTSPQENANAAWRRLATELGFIWDTVEPAPGKGPRCFRAQSI